ncbi:unnamed protein product, partial [Amoebophrya sp. A25]|eukprot:GSA25T00005975001.1
MRAARTKGTTPDEREVTHSGSTTTTALTSMSSSSSSASAPTSAVSPLIVPPHADLKPTPTDAAQAAQAEIVHQ